jgi:hypothetical protein
MRARSLLAAALRRTGLAAPNGPPLPLVRQNLSQVILKNVERGGEQIERAIGFSRIAATTGQHFHALGLARNNASPVDDMAKSYFDFARLHRQLREGRLSGAIGTGRAWRRKPGRRSGSLHHDQHRRGLLEFLSRPLESLALVGRFDFAKSYGVWESGVDIPANGWRTRFLRNTHPN